MNHIHQAFAIYGIDTTVYRVACDVKRSRMTYDVDIYVVITIFANNVEYGHIPLHLIKSVANKNNSARFASNSPFHIVNNIHSRRARIRVSRESNVNIRKGITLSIGTHTSSGPIFDNTLLKIFNVIFIIINRYSVPTNILSLNNKFVKRKDPEIENYVALIKGSYPKRYTGVLAARNTAKQ